MLARSERVAQINIKRCELALTCRLVLPVGPEEIIKEAVVIQDTLLTLQITPHLRF